MMRYVVLGALLGFGLAVLALAAFGTQGGLFPGPPPAQADAGVPPARIEALSLPTRPVVSPGARPIISPEARPVPYRPVPRSADAGS